MVSEFLFYEEDAVKTEKSNYIGLKIEIRDLLREDFNRKILTQILLDLQKDVSGDTQKRLFKLYQDLGLEKYAFKKLESWRWEVVSKGILELTLMQVEQAYPFIVRFINDRRGTIRKQAEIATVTLMPRGISYFLDTTKYKISEWQQLKLLDVVRNKEDFEPPRFKAWLTSTNTQVVLFALRLIKYYNQNDANASLIELAKHKDRQVKQLAIDCIKEFHIVKALPTLKGIFPKCTVDVKLGILGAIAELGTTSDLEFLENVSQRDGNFSVKSKAVGAINTIAPESIMPTENIEHITVYTSPVIDDGKIKRNAIEEETAGLEQAREGPESNIPEEDLIPADSEPTKINCQIPNNDSLIIPTPMANPKKSDKSVKKIEVDFEEMKAGSFEDIEGYSLSDFEVIFEEKGDAAVSEENEKVAFDLKDVPIIDVKSPKVEDVMSWLLADNELREIELKYDIVPYPSDAEVSNQFIPSPVYYDEHETYMMGLLDDLEELGDLREIPLLKALREEESKRFIKERITGMIEKFSREPVAKRKASSNTVNESADLPVFSVFADLFKNIDTECKLILLDEIVPVGDEKEIEFLNGLHESPDQRIQKKAQIVLKLLIAKLSHENPEALKSKGISDIVAEQGVCNTDSEEESFDHLLSALEVSPAVAPEIFDIDFELCEVLDKNYEQKILDIPVIVTDVSSNANGGSFFNSLRKFTKLFF